MLLKVSISPTESLCRRKSDRCNLCTVVYIACVADLRVLAYVADEYDFVYHIICMFLL